ncbi:hypothetical protein C0J50_20068 [Silurus asotus]|uniref:Uncharacterized protein n=1 Tax=Silurus asotus TaxID=30991 RepID=A0AAD5AQM0_SILAS|nr:hypothetical protein C0J50_20068 [Silurus asotus]
MKFVLEKRREEKRREEKRREEKRREELNAVLHSLDTQTHMERPEMVNGDQLPPPYNPTCPQPYAQEARNAGEAGIFTVTQCSNNVETADVLPPEYTQCFEDVNCFSEASVRRGFIRKVYLTLMIQLLITVGIICAFLYWNTLKLWVIRTSWFSYAMIMKSVECVCFRFFSAEAVLWAVGATALVSFSLSVFAMQSKWDFTTVSGTIWVLCWTLFSFGLLCAIMRSQFLYIAYASLGTLVFSIYLVMDTQLMLGGKHKYTISAEEYIFASLNLYLDIVTIFLLILQMIGLCR